MAVWIALGYRLAIHIDEIRSVALRDEVVINPRTTTL
jgi:hypothetical protein